MVQETRTKQIPVCTTKPVHYTKTVEVCRMVPKKVAYTVTRCVPRVVYREVGCCGDVIEAAPEVADEAATEEDAGEAAAE